MRIGTTSARAGFTLVELLVVIGIIAVLISLLLPALNRAQEQARTVKCMSNLRVISQALFNYTTDNGGCVVPGYNLPFAPGATTNFTGGPQQPLDGWPAILDRDGYVKSPAQSVDTAFYCPDTDDVPGLASGATGTQITASQVNPRGWVDWPMIFTVVGGDTEPKQAVTIPALGFNKIIRCSYWINAYHPTGQTLSTTQIAQKDLFYTTVVGFGPSSSTVIKPHRVSAIRHSSLTITVADGVFMGRQSDDKLGMTNLTIGYRHRGATHNNFAANVGFADGHVETLTSDQFPCGYATSSSYASANGTTTLAQQEQQNLGGPTVYPDPQSAIQTFLLANPGAN